MLSVQFFFLDCIIIIIRERKARHPKRPFCYCVFVLGYANAKIMYTKCYTKINTHLLRIMTKFFFINYCRILKKAHQSNLLLASPPLHRRRSHRLVMLFSLSYPGLISNKINRVSAKCHEKKQRQKEQKLPKGIQKSVTLRFVLGII